MATVYTSVGESLVTDYTTGDASPPADFYIGWGTDNTAADKADTDLITAANESRVAVVETQPSADTAQWVATITSGSSQTIQEAGLFDAAGSGNPPSGGNLLIRSVFTGIPLGNGDKIEFTFTLEQT